MAARNPYRLYTVTPEHFDVTQRHFALMSPVQCDDLAYDVDNNLVTNYEVNYVLNPSLDIYTFSDSSWSCWELSSTERSTFAWNLPRDDTDIV